MILVGSPTKNPALMALLEIGEMSMTLNKMLSRDDAYLPRDPLSRDRLVAVNVGESKTRQADAESANINAIIDRYARTGMMPPARFDPAYADVTGLQGDLTERYNDARDLTARFQADTARAEALRAEKAAAAASAPATQSVAPSPAGEPTPTP